MSRPRYARAEFLSYQEVQMLIDAAPTAYIPLGTLEFHGPHLPIGLDALTAHGVCLEAARTTGGIVLPPIFQGFGGGHRDYPWTIMMSDGDGISRHLLQTLVRLEELGVETAVVFSGHFAPEQLDMVDDVTSVWRDRASGSLRLVGTAVNRCDTAPLPPDHAGRFETTLLAGIAPELVHLERLPAGGVPSTEGPGVDPYGEYRHEQSQPLWGVFGPDPREAKIEEGTSLLKHLGGWLAAQTSDAEGQAPHNSDSQCTTTEHHPRF